MRVARKPLACTSCSLGDHTAKLEVGQACETCGAVRMLDFRDARTGETWREDMIEKGSCA